MTLHFEAPAWLWLLTAIPVLMALAAIWLRGEEPLRLAPILVVRAVLLSLLVVAVARPSLVRTHDDLAVVALVDVSESVRRFGMVDEVKPDGAAAGAIGAVRSWLRAASASKRPDDRLGVVLFDGRSTVASSPRRDAIFDDDLDRVQEEGTDIADAIRLGAALLPADALRRLVLVSDGNETSGSAMAAAREVAAGSRRALPIDVVPVPYHAGEDVRIVRLEGPPTARPGQLVALRAVLEATAPRRGTLQLVREGAIVDLQPDAETTGLPVNVATGTSVHPILAIVDDRPIQRFVVTFVPDGSPDAIPENDRADAVVANPSAGAVLVLRGDRGSEADAVSADDEAPIVALLRGMKRPVVAGPPSIMPQSLLEMQGFDLVILDNVAAGQLDLSQQALLAHSVDRLGAGLVMGGGPTSFGAGGWRGTALEPMLPVRLELPKALQAPRAALVLVLDRSGSMAFPVAGARASQQQVANEAAALAIESLAARSYVGVVAFEQFADVIVPIQPNDDPQAIAASVRTIRPNGGTNIASGLDAARDMLASLPASPRIEEKRVVLLTDGRSRSGPIESVVDGLVAEGAAITTIAVGDDTDEDVLRRIAKRGGGSFYAVRNPRTLPRVLVDSVQVVNRPLIREGEFVPQPADEGLPSGARFRALLGDAPPLGGLVLTARRDEPSAVVEWVAPPVEGALHAEPVLAHWPAGLGRVVAFTSEIDGPWAREWLAWPGWTTLWTELVRVAARPALGAGLSLDVRPQEDRLVVTLTVEDSGAATGSPTLDPDSVAAALTLYGPRLRPMSADLRRSGPRTFMTEVPLPDAGAYVVVVAPKSGATPLAPLVAGATRPHGEEFGRLRSNVALLKEIADTTGGRLLDLTTETAPELFDRAGMDPVRSQRGIWPWLVWPAALLLVLDVAARRIAWSPSRVRRALDQAREAARDRSERGAETASHLRGRAKPAAAPAPEGAGLAAMTGGSATEIAGAPAQERQASPSGSAEESRSRPVPRDADAIRAALDALRGAPRDRARFAVPPPPRDAQGGTREPSPGGGTGDDQGHDQLMAAKRRARERFDG